jgi:hypothetical protein
MHYLLVDRIREKLLDAEMSVGLNSFDHARFGVITAVLVYRYVPEELTVSLIRVVQE